MLRRLRKTLKIAIVTFVVAIALVTIFQSWIIYIPHPYSAGVVERWSTQPGAKVLDYQTADGPQQAYLLSRSANPKRLWVVCGGSGSVALEWSNWLRDRGPQNDAWLLVDMPGYGACGGSPNPESIARSMKAVVPLAVQTLSWTMPEAKGRLRFFGHSIGSAVCLIAARENDIRRGVLMTPFTTTMEMTSVRTGIPLGFLVWHRFDNGARLREIEAKGGGRVILLHGTEDASIPVQMSRDLAKMAPETARVNEIQGGEHNNLPTFAPQEIEKALFAISEER